MSWHLFEFSRCRSHTGRIRRGGPGPCVSVLGNSFTKSSLDQEGLVMGAAVSKDEVTREPFSSTLGPKMVAVQNYHGNPAPPGKPVLTFQTGDVIELLRGDPDSPWWEVSPGSWRWGFHLTLLPVRLPRPKPGGQGRWRRVIGELLTMASATSILHVNSAMSSRS